MMIPNQNEVEALASSTKQGNGSGFICGVVEGFYGLPWTMDQRRKLFTRMSSLGMNTYIYAPKDDLKHRMHWRDLYTVDEAEPLTTLIESARDHGITFVYALSPGLDITYSSTKDISFLKHKLEQVASFGCEAFALLFDDIDVELCDSDKSLYQSFAAAQVSVTNEAYQHLRQPLRFFFCPTEYCASRAVPTVTQSEYLNTVGSKLLPDIEVMWTGPKVISKRITIHSIEEVSRVLRRKPLIWDNLHANDYDPKRLFLGPYDGRSPRLVPHLRGVLTNPNCEFESDFVALHTLAQWSRASDDGGKKDLTFNGGPVNADIRLETEGSSSSSSSTDDEDLSESTDNSPVEYTPRQALRRAITAWLPEFSVTTPPISSLQRKAAIGIIPSPIIPTYVPPISGGNKAVDQMALLEVGDGYVQPVPLAIPTSSLVKLSESETSSIVADTEPMDCAVTPGSTPATCSSVAASVEEDTTVNSTGDDVDSVEEATVSPTKTTITADDAVIANNMASVVSTERMQIDGELSLTSPSMTLTTDDVTTIVDMFYLPFEHGPRAARLLQDFFWIKTHAVEALSTDVPPLIGSTVDTLLVGGSCCDDCDTTSGGDRSDDAVQPDDWREQVRTFLVRLRWICDTIDRMLAIPNRALACELFPYLWDIKAALFLLDSFVQWLGKTASEADVVLGWYVVGCLNWMHCQWRHDTGQSVLYNLTLFRM
jgi:protein O-GlcNAcase/histone acetyltransferase